MIVRLSGVPAQRQSVELESPEAFALVRRAVSSFGLRDAASWGHWAASAATAATAVTAATDAAPAAIAAFAAGSEQLEAK